MFSIPQNQDPDRLPETTVGATARGVAATCSAWDRATAGANPAALTNFKVGQRSPVPLELLSRKLLSGITSRRPPLKRDGAGHPPKHRDDAHLCAFSSRLTGP